MDNFLNMKALVGDRQFAIYESGGANDYIAKLNNFPDFNWKKRQNRRKNLPAALQSEFVGTRISQ
ncbi:MAG: hypothetical protein IKU11_10020 [Clostridia bacterium]|nr:hypothetical protein [Clostridia bacterium]